MTDGIRTTHPAQGRVTGDNVELAFGYWPGRGAPLVALHGLTASHVSFAGIAECLAGRRPLFALDLRGRGDSAKPAGPYGMAQHAEDVAAAMGAMGLGTSIIVGHSMGAFVATALAAAHPELVSGLLLIDGGYAPAISTPNSQQGLDAALALRITQLRQTYPSREVYRQFWRDPAAFSARRLEPVGRSIPRLRNRRRAAGAATQSCGGCGQGRPDGGIAERSDRRAAPGDPSSCTHDPGTRRVRAGCASTLSRRDDRADAKLAPSMEDELIPGTTHYTLVMGKKGASRIADLADDFAARCESRPT